MHIVGMWTVSCVGYVRVCCLVSRVPPPVLALLNIHGIYFGYINEEDFLFYIHSPERNACITILPPAEAPRILDDPVPSFA